VEVGALGRFLVTTFTQVPGIQAAGPDVFGLVAEGMGGGPDLAGGAADATVAVWAEGRLGALQAGDIRSRGSQGTLVGTVPVSMPPLARGSVVSSGRGDKCRHTSSASSNSSILF